MIEVRDLHFQYPDGTRALSGVTVDLETPVFALVCGANGQGKSTFLYLLAGLYRPSKGTIRVFGSDPARWKPGDGRQVGLVFQDPDVQMIGETVEEDVAFGLENMGLARREMEERLQRVLSLYGLEALRDRPCHTLSGGQKRRVALAAVLAMEPRVVLFDEPFSNLDEDGVRVTLELMVRLREEGRSVLVSTHDVEKVAAYAERILVLREGRLVRQGIPREVAPELGRYGVRPPCSVLLGKGLVPWLSV